MKKRKREQKQFNNALKLAKAQSSSSPNFAREDLKSIMATVDVANQLDANDCSDVEACEPLEQSDDNNEFSDPDDKDYHQAISFSRKYTYIDSACVVFPEMGPATDRELSRYRRHSRYL
jgi:hypothetical protein